MSTDPPAAGTAHPLARAAGAAHPLARGGRGGICLLFLILLFFSGSTPGGRWIVQNEFCALDASHMREGRLRAAWFGDRARKVKLLITSPGGTVYQYDLCGPSVDDFSRKWEFFPFSEGSGDYTAAVCRNLSGIQYTPVLTRTFPVTLADERAPFLRANQYVRFTEQSAAVQKAAVLCEGIEGSAEKTDRIYQFVIRHIAYDAEKAEQVQSGYLPNVDQTLACGRGICFDYAALTAAMLRAQGVPAKLVTGYAGNVFHAWVEAWIGTAWKRLDPTFASAALQDGALWDFIGDGQNYTPRYYY